MYPFQLIIKCLIKQAYVYDCVDTEYGRNIWEFQNKKIYIHLYVCNLHNEIKFCHRKLDVFMRVVHVFIYVEMLQYLLSVFSMHLFS